MSICSTFYNLAKIYWSASGGAMQGCLLNVQPNGASLDSGIRLALTIAEIEAASWVG